MCECGVLLSFKVFVLYMLNIFRLDFFWLTFLENPKKGLFLQNQTMLKKTWGVKEVEETHFLCSVVLNVWPPLILRFWSALQHPETEASAYH